MVESILKRPLKIMRFSRRNLEEQIIVISCFKVMLVHGRRPWLVLFKKDEIEI